jgi:D-glycero-D-manno-heptose 1,7-bisphosphate phosphatase
LLQEKMFRRAALLDRDGTIIEDRHYLSDPGGVKLLPGVGQSLRGLADLGLILVVVTNQSGIGRGLFSGKQAQAVHEEMVRQLARECVLIENIYVCPHAPEEGCRCRKPAPGLVEKAVRELGFSPEESFVFGDRECDIELGQRVGATTFLVRSNYVWHSDDRAQVEPDYVVDGIGQAVPVIESLLKVTKKAHGK